MEYIALALFALVMIAMVLPTRRVSVPVAPTSTATTTSMPTAAPVSPAAG
ncbi:MAG: hypothetical protein WKF80_01740 [Thermomicrobiales bacterium]